MELASPQLWSNRILRKRPLPGARRAAEKPPRRESRQRRLRFGTISPFLQPMQVALISKHALVISPSSDGVPTLRQSLENGDFCGDRPLPSRELAALGKRP